MTQRRPTLRWVRSSILCACLVASGSESATAATVDVEGGEEAIVRIVGSVMATYRSEGDTLYVRARADVELRPGPTCVAEEREVRCDGVRRLKILGGSAPEIHYVETSLDSVSVETGAGADRVDVDAAGRQRIFISDSSRQDHVSFSPSSAPIRDPIVVSESSIDTDDRIQIVGARYLTLTGYADTVVSRGAKVNDIYTGHGSDRLYLKDGWATTVRCLADGLVEIDHGLDRLERCGVLNPIPPPPPSPFAKDLPTTPANVVDPRWGALGLLESPQPLGRVVAMRLGVVPGSTAEATLAVAPWEDKTQLRDAGVGRSGPAGADGLDLSLPVDVATEQALQREGRLRARLRLRVTHPDGHEELREGTFTLVVVRAWLGRRDGRKVLGSFGSQRLLGSPLGDLVEGASGNDQLGGGRGADRLRGGTGNDLLDGGPGDDLLDGDDGDDVLLGGAGADHLIEGRFGDDRLDGGSGDDVLVGLRGVDTLIGGRGDDILDGGSGPDVMDCGPGEDIAFVNNTRDRNQLKDCEEIHSGTGVDARSCRQGGTTRAETLLGTEGDDHCVAGSGTDDLEGRGGNDRLDGGDGADRLFGRFGDDVLRGGTGDDELEGGRGADQLFGGAGNDQLNGGFDPDVISGGAGRDRIVARGGGADRINCGAGKDVAIVDSADVVRSCEDVRRSGVPRARR